MKVVLVLMTLLSSAAFAGSDGCAIAGPDNARVTIEEYADLQCPYCKVGSDVIEQVIQKYPNTVRVVFRNMPLTKIHSHAYTAAKAMAATCLNSPDAAYAFQSELFKHTEELANDEDVIYQVADQIGLDVRKLKRDMESKAVADSLKADEDLAKVHGFRGTPSFMIGDESLKGAYPFEDFDQAIQRQLGI